MHSKRTLGIRVSSCASNTTTRGITPPAIPSRICGVRLGLDITTIMSILQVVRSAEVSDLVAKFRKAKHGVDRIRIILDNQDLINRELPRDVSELIRAKNAALQRADKYNMCKNRSHVRALQHTAWNMLGGWKRRFVAVSLPPKDDLDPITHDEVSKHIKGLKLKKAPGDQLALFSDDTALYLRSNSIWRIDVNPNKSASIYFDYSTQLRTISKFMKDASERFFDIASSHTNLLLVSDVSYEPPPPHNFCRRPRNVLLDPPNDLTIEVEKLIKLNKMAID
ncbi:hypothetical protein EVAR_58261_1 [Eumeta japonica]|uniref:Uncharacterized protein n=1 Tax=Eumeta variegata TaxID=151549 RepID=A0A4C1ZGS8_EUMVA|nr:hypothetical protein EVAR_58261_1 [Eumeta japonica]